MSNSSGDPYRKALNSALRILARREHSSVELAQKLMRRGHAEAVVQQVILECLRLNYLDDRRVLRQVLDGMQRKGFGPQRIRHELLKRGLAAGESDCGAAECMPPEEERSTASRVALKKWKSLQQEPEPGRRRLRLMRFLRSRGFSYAVIYDVMETLEGPASEDPPSSS
ncbi:MAG TPA: RecX family transcriptional regulator [Desulfobacterales bacterium]|nr:RecX family transcriptional regulator [Desulfobacterales bacterium]